MKSVIKSLFVNQNSSAQFLWIIIMSILKKLKSTKTAYLLLRPVMKDESTTSNNIQILNDIFENQFDVPKSDVKYDHALQLVYEDLKTFLRIQSVKSLHRNISEQSYDHFNWLLPELKLWHLHFNMLKLIHHIHWGEIQSADVSILQYAVNWWSWTQVIQLNDFQVLKDLIIHSYRTQITAVWIWQLQSQCESSWRIEETISWLEAHYSSRSVTWCQMLEAMSSYIHLSISNVNKQTAELDHNQSFENHQNYCLHVKHYLILSYIIKNADIDLLHYALCHITILFQNEMSEVLKYAQALLYTLHLIDSSAATIQLQECLLTNSLINLQGVSNFNFELNHLLELLNNNLKTFLHERSYFFKNSDRLLKHWALNEPYFLKLKSIMKLAFEKRNSSLHSTKSASEDIWSMIFNLAIQFIERINHDQFLLNLIINLYLEELRKLNSNVIKYNQQYLNDRLTAYEIEDNELNSDIITDIPSVSQMPDSSTLSLNSLDFSDSLKNW